MKTVLVVAMMAMALSGCSDSKDLEKAIRAFSKSCKGTLSAEFHTGSYNRSLTLKCDDFNAKDME